MITAATRNGKKKSLCNPPALMPLDTEDEIQKYPVVPPQFSVFSRKHPYRYEKIPFLCNGSSRRLLHTYISFQASARKENFTFFLIPPFHLTAALCVKYITLLALLLRI